jgi:hypothetical protein
VVSGLHVAGEVVIRQSGAEVETLSGVALDRGLPSQVWWCGHVRQLMLDIATNLHLYDWNSYTSSGNPETAIVPS